MFTRVCGLLRTLVNSQASEEFAIQCVSPAAGIRNVSEKTKKIWEMVSWEAVTSRRCIPDGLLFFL